MLFSTHPQPTTLGLVLNNCDDSEDDILDMDDTNTLKEPLSLVTRNLAMQVQSQLLRENKPAVLLLPYKYISCDQAL